MSPKSTSTASSVQPVSLRTTTGLGVFAASLAFACGNDVSTGVTCGEGTMLAGDVCVVMVDDGPADVPPVGASCGAGTVLNAGVCLPEVAPLVFELEDEPSGYAELVEHLDDMGANDGRGHLDQDAIARWIGAGVSGEQIEFLFDHGDELTEIEFRVDDGVGSLLAPDGSPLISRFTRVPTGTRFTGPNAESCLSCHGAPIGNSGGLNVANVMQDPQPGVDGLFNPRQTISINGGGLIQILAEDMTEELQALKAEALANPGTEVALTVKGGSVDYGTLTCDAGGDCNYEDVVGVSPDLIVRPMGWKGNFPTLRGFSSDAAFGEMGMQSDEVLWKQTTAAFSTDTPNADGDGDGVTHELSVGDVTALTMYLSMQEMPTSVMDLVSAGAAEVPSADLATIAAGEALFDDVGCTGCHVAQFALSTTEFMEPSPRAGGTFEDADLAGRVASYGSATPLVVDLSGELADLPRVVRAGNGTATIQPYTDLKRHFMGARLADDAKAYFPKNASQFDVTSLPADADAASVANLSTQIPLGEFLTPELWGVGNTGPWLHDGRAPTLREAILLHGVETLGGGGVRSEAQASRDAFAGLDGEEQEQLLAFLKNLVLVDLNPPEE